MKNIKTFISEYGALGDRLSDSEEYKVRHRFLIYMGTLMGGGGLLWGFLSFFFENYFSSIIPFGYAFLTIVNFTYFYFTKDFIKVRFFQVLMSLLLPFFFQWALGGFIPSGAVMLWAMVAIVGSLTFADAKSNIRWLLVYLAFTILTGLLDGMIQGHKIEVSPTAQTFFFVINITVISSIVFGLTIYLLLKRDQAVQAYEDKNTEIVDLLEKQEQKVEDRTVELKLAKDEAEMANRAKSKFLANMSHELRTPLNAIMGYAQILIKDKEIPENKKRNLDIIQQSSIHLLNMINDILDLAKIEAQKTELTRNNFNLSGILKNVSDIFRMQAKKKEVSFLSEISSDVPDAVYGDAQKLRQVLMNLLNNAVKFTDTGRIIFKVDCNKGKICFQVDDTGIGIAPDVVKEIFMPFQQVHKQDQIIEGTGLGLAISRNLTQLMGGELKVESKVGIGSVFRFELRLPTVPNFVETIEANKENVIGYTGKRRKVLVVDDNEENRSILISTLTPLGFEIIEAVNGQDGLNKTNKFKPDLILIDLIMPVMNGYEAIRQIRKIPNGQKIIIISISASVFDLNREKSLKVGSNDFIGKPFILEELLHLIRTHLKLDWIYDKRKVETIEEEDYEPLSSSEPFIVPPQEEISILFDLVMRGNIHGILERTDRIKETDDRFIPFATELRKLAKKFKVKKMQEFVKQYME